MTAHTGHGPQIEQGALFGDPALVDPSGNRSNRPAATQDVELVASVVRAAGDPGYRVVERSGRVFRVDPARRGAVEDVPRYEAETVLQLLDARLLDLGGNHSITYHGNTGPSRSVLVPTQTRQRVARWGALKPLPTPRRGTDGPEPTSGDDSREAPPVSATRWCPECGEPAHAVPPSRWTRANGPRPRSSHLDGTPLCPVMTDRGYRPARLTARRPH